MHSFIWILLYIVILVINTNTQGYIMYPKTSESGPKAVSKVVHCGIVIPEIEIRNEAANHGLNTSYQVM